MAAMQLSGASGSWYHVPQTGARVGCMPTRYTDRDGSDGVVDVSEIGSALRIGRRVVVTGMAGAGKSTFARQLSAKTGLPAIHLDVHFWKPGWVEPSDKEWRDVQSTLLAGEEWIANRKSTRLNSSHSQISYAVFCLK